MRKLLALTMLLLLLAVSLPAQVKISGTAKVGGTVKSGVATAGGGCTGTLCTSLVASWKLDDLTDATGRGNTLTNSTSVAFVTGKIGNAGEFVAASSKYLSKTSSADVNPGSTEWSIGFWYKPASTTAEQNLIGLQDDVSGGGYVITVEAGGVNIIFRPKNAAGGNSGSATTSPSFSNGTWYCVVVRHSVADGIVYINVNDTAFTGTGGIDNGPTAGSTAEFRIGARAYPGFQGYADAVIDNVNVWTKKLSSTEITAFYNSGTGVEYPYTTP